MRWARRHVRPPLGYAAARYSPSREARGVRVRVPPPTPNECSLGRAKGWPRRPSVEGRSSLSRGPSRLSSPVKIERVGERGVRGGSPARAEPDAGCVQAACGDGDLVAAASQRVDVAAGPGSGVAAFEVVPAEFVVGHVVGCQMITIRVWATAKVPCPRSSCPSGTSCWCQRRRLQQTRHGRTADPYPRCDPRVAALLQVAPSS